MSTNRLAGEPDVHEQSGDQAASGAVEVDPARRVAELEKELADTNDRRLRALAEQENIRRRAAASDGRQREG